MAYVTMTIDEYMELVAKTGSTTHSFSGYSPIPQATPPERWQGYGPVPTPMAVPHLVPKQVPHPAAQAIPHLVPRLIPHPTLAPYKTPESNQSAPNLVPGYGNTPPLAGPVTPPPMLGNDKEPMLVPHHDPFAGVHSPSYLASQHEDDFTDLINLAEQQATHDALTVYKQKLEQGKAKVQQAHEKEKKEVEAQTYGDAMDAFYAARLENYVRELQTGLANHLAEQAQTNQDLKNKRKEIKEKQHELAKEQLDAEIAEKKAKKTNPPG